MFLALLGLAYNNGSNRTPFQHNNERRELGLKLFSDLF